MATITSKLGKIFKRREGDSKTPSRALYDDLESAHESITRKTSSTNTAALSWTRLSSQAPSPMSEDRMPSHSLTVIAPTVPPRRLASLPKPSQRRLVHTGQRFEYPLHRVGRVDTSDDTGYDLPSCNRLSSDLPLPARQSSNEAGSQWQTTVSETPDGRSQVAGYQRRLLQSEETVSQLQMPSFGSGSNMPCTGSSPSFEHEGDDTVDRIYQRCTQHKSSHVRQGISMQSTVWQRTTNTAGTPSINLPGPEKMVLIPESSSRVVQAGQPYSNEHVVPAHGENYDDPTQSLHQFAWSPCPSDLDDHDSLQEFCIRDQYAKTTGDLNSTRKSEDALSAGSYDNTQALLELPSSHQSGNTAGSSDSRLLLSSSSVGTSKAAGDLILPCPNRAAFEREPDSHESSRISGIIFDGRSSRAMSEVELEESLSVFMRSVLGSSATGDAGKEQVSDAEMKESHNIVHQASSAAQGHRVGDLTIGKGRNNFHCLSFNEDANTDLYSTPLQQASPALLGHQDGGSNSSGSYKKVLPVLKDTVMEHDRLPHPKTSQVAYAAIAGMENHSRSKDSLDTSPKQGWVTQFGYPTEHTLPEKQPSDEMTSSNNFDNDLDICHIATSASSSPTNRSHSQQQILFPRYNDSWSIVRNLRTDSLVMFRDYVLKEGRRLPNSNANFHPQRPESLGHRGHYQHPKPLPSSHPHPSTSSLHMSPSHVHLGGQHGKSMKHFQGMQTASKFSDTEFSESSIERNPTSHAEVSQQPLAAVYHDEKSERERSNHLRAPSYLWPNPTSEEQTSGPSMRLRADSLTTTVTLDRRGNPIDTSAGLWAQETGSSLANRSSLQEGSSSSSVVTLGSLSLQKHFSTSDGVISSTKGNSAIDMFHQKLENNTAHGGVETIHKLAFLSDSLGGVARYGKRRCMSKSIFRSIGPSQNTQDGEMDWNMRLVDTDRNIWASNSGSLKSGLAVQKESRKRIERFENFEDSTWQAYLPPLGPTTRLNDRTTLADKSEEHSTITGYINSLTRGRVGRYTSEQRPNSNDLEKNAVIERKATDRECFDKVDNGKRVSEARYVPPASHNPLSRSTHGSPHYLKPRLYDHFNTPDASMKARHRYYSRLWALICFVLPFLGPLYGHGYLDKVMSWHSDGAIEGFRKQEKLAVLLYSYLIFVGCLIALSITMVVISR